MFDFWLPVSSHRLDNKSIATLDPNNMGIAFGISFLPHLGADILELKCKYIRFGGRHIWFLTSGFIPQCWHQLHWKAWPRKWGHRRRNFLRRWYTSEVTLAGMMDFVKILLFPVSGRHIGFLDRTRLDLIIPFCSPSIFRISHQSILLNSKRFQNGTQKTDLGGNLTPRLPCEG